VHKSRGGCPVGGTQIAVGDATRCETVGDIGTMLRNISMPGASIPIRCQACPFRGRDIFAAARPQVRMPIRGSLQHRQVPARRAVHHANDPGGSVCVVRAGLVKLVQHCSSGTQRIVRLLTGGGVGEPRGEPAEARRRAATRRTTRLVRLRHRVAIRTGGR
jgi:hypothetical protein